MTDYTTINRVALPAHVITMTMEALRLAGARGAEAFVLWVGARQGSTFAITDSYVPRQTGYVTTSGVCVVVGADELHWLNVWLYEQQLELLVQVHSHPTDAYHSETDDTYPIATRIGSFSLVIPNFAVADFTLDQVAAYRLGVDLSWQELALPEKRAIFHLENGAPRATSALST